MTKLLDRNRPEYVPHIFQGNFWLAASQQNRKGFDPPCLLRHHTSIHIIERSANLFPIYLRAWPNDNQLFADESTTSRRLGDKYVNLSDAALSYIQSRGNLSSAVELFRHAAAVLHAPAYSSENADALRQDWPRVPLPESSESLMASGRLGRVVADLLDPEAPIEGVTSGGLRPEMKVIGVVARAGGGSLNASAGELDVTARWGSAGKGGVCMPGKGRAEERDYSKAERDALIEGGTALGLDEATVFGCLGETTFDVYLNPVAFWRNVPCRVWDYTLGGYQAVKKWLPYREKALLGRGLTLREVSYVGEVIRRIAALRLLAPALDDNYRAVKSAVYPWTDPPRET